MEKWICCGIDIIGLCNRAGSVVPDRCFFCGNPRTTVTVPHCPEDRLAFELAEIWTGKIREFHGDPEAHAPSLDRYGRMDVEAWRAVARRVLDLILSSYHDKPDTQSTRDALVDAVQAYAVEWAAGKSTIYSQAKATFSNALNCHEFAVWDKSRFALVAALCEAGDGSERNRIRRSSTYGKPDTKTE